MATQHEPNQPRAAKTPLTFQSNASDGRVAVTPRTEMTANGDSGGNKLPYRVCVVEDSFKHLTTLFAALNEHAHQADHFANIEDGLAAIERNNYQVAIISDTTSGGTAACEAFITRARASSHARLKTIPILVLTSDASEDRRNKLASFAAIPIAPAISGKQLHQTMTSAVNSVPPPSVAPKRILLVEDSYALTWSLWNALTAAGHEVDHALSTQDALELARTARHDVMIIGHHDAGKSPSEPLLGRLRFAKRRTDATAPIIALTDDLSESNVKLLRRAGIQAVLTRDPHRAKEQIVVWLTHGIPQNQIEPAPAAVTELTSTAADAPSNFHLGNLDAVPEPSLPKLDLYEPLPALLTAPQTQATGTAGKPMRLALIIVLVLTGALGGWWIWSIGLGGTRVEVIAASTTALAHTVNVSGHVISTRQVDLPATRTGQLYRVYVENGQLVRKGEPLATLDNREALINVRRAEAQVFRLRSEVDLVDETLRAYTTMDPDAINPEALLETKTAKTLAQNRLRAAENELGAVQLELDRSAISAPFAGMVVYSKAVEGKWVEAGETLYAIADLDALEIALQIHDPNETTTLTANQTVNLATTGSDADEWSAKITRLAPPDPAGSTSSSRDRDNIVAYVTVDENAPPLILGQRIHGEVAVEMITASVTVPVEAVILHKGAEHIAVARGNRADFVPVEIGVHAYPDLEITRGVTRGDLIILPRRPLRDGQRISPARITLPATDSEATYPLRAQFADVRRHSINDLGKRYRDALIVDVRSKQEYDILRISDAFNIPLTDANFIDRVRALRQKNQTAPLVFYCANAACPDSYIAMRKAEQADIKDTFAYDSGIFEWMHNHHHHTTLLGINPMPRDRLISRAYYHARLLDRDGLANQAKQPSAVVVSLDFGDNDHAEAPADSLHLTLPDFIDRLDGAQWRDKTLVILDTRGDRLWVLQYLIEYKNHRDYFFYYPVRGEPAR